MDVDGFLNSVRNEVNSGKYYSVCIQCSDFSQSVEVTRLIIDSGIAVHGESGASKCIYDGKQWNGKGLLFPFVKVGYNYSYIEYYYRYPIKSPDAIVISYDDFCENEEDINVDIDAFLGM